MKESVLGFIFNDTLNKVLLILKKRPIYQAGFMNGIGGKVEEGETQLEALKREVFEECNLEIEQTRWNKIGDFGGTDHWNVGVFFSVLSDEELSRAYTKTDENIIFLSVREVGEVEHNMFYNTRGFIFLILESIQNPEHKYNIKLNFSL